MVSLSAFTCFGKLPLSWIQKAIAGRVPLHLSVLGPPHPEEGQTGVSISRSCLNHLPGPVPMGWHPGGAGEWRDQPGPCLLPFLISLER